MPLLTLGRSNGGYANRLLYMIDMCIVLIVDNVCIVLIQ